MVSLCCVQRPAEKVGASFSDVVSVSSQSNALFPFLTFCPGLGIHASVLVPNSLRCKHPEPCVVCFGGRTRVDAGRGAGRMWRRRRQAQAPAFHALSCGADLKKLETWKDKKQETLFWFFFGPWPWLSLMLMKVRI